MKLINTTEAVGHVLCQDITQIIRGVTKDAVFRKGHIVREEDIPVLLSVGKEHLYVWEQTEGMLHENDGAEILREICQGEDKKGGNMTASEPKEGKIELSAACDGLFQVKREALKCVNSMGQMMVATRHGDTPVRKGDKLCGTRIIPLVIEEEKMKAARAAAMERSDGAPLLSVLPFQHKKCAVIATGSEVYKGRIKDTFTPVILDKLSEYDTEILRTELCDDRSEMLTELIQKALSDGADVVICTGGMSVDPDDKTPLAIRNTGARVVSYGAPVLPGAMFMLAYTKENKAILGLPGCVMYAKRTIFDLVLPHIMAEDEVTADMLSALGEGGLCLNCPVCTYPNCGFGK